MYVYAINILKHTVFACMRKYIWVQVNVDMCMYGDLVWTANLPLSLNSMPREVMSHYTGSLEF